jgi:hypothetical protein
MYGWDYSYLALLYGWDYFQPPEEERDSYNELLAIKRAIAMKEIIDKEELSCKIGTIGTLLQFPSIFFFWYSMIF